MKKIETIWHYILYKALKDGQYKHTQQEIAEIFGYSLSTVNLSLNAPSQIGAIKKSSKFFTLADPKKLLYFCASLRNLQRDIIYKACLEVPVAQIEGFAPSQSIFACYTAAKNILGEPPADYSKVYIYLEEKDLPEVIKKYSGFMSKKGTPNFFVLKKHESLKRYGDSTSSIQTFVDIWNLSDWYAKDFLDVLERKMGF